MTPPADFNFILIFQQGERAVCQCCCVCLRHTKWHCNLKLIVRSLLQAQRITHQVNSILCLLFSLQQQHITPHSIFLHWLAYFIVGKPRSEVHMNMISLHMISSHFIERRDLTLRRAAEGRERVQVWGRAKGAAAYMQGKSFSSADGKTWILCRFSF